ncbi:D-Ala-D-Ala carboxypeptidase family metallohydrolase [Ensifer sp. 4252]|uniref:D-Ala-D-Ala carboxypeptidase family metallohydrolase n=1 Tax=Ensifer sp. 4252 TaxID=3373915 RepID=UPI003D2133F2
MQHWETRGALLATFSRAAAISVSLFALSGCVSAVADNEAATALKVEETQEALQVADSTRAGATVRDAQVSAAGGNPQTAQGNSALAQGQDPAQQGGPLTMQSTGLRAASSSIYGQAPTAGAQPQATGSVPATGAAQPSMNATTNSLFSGSQGQIQPQPQPQPQPIIQPQQGAANDTSGAPSDTAVMAYAAPEGAALPASVPLPLSAQAALGGKTSRVLQPVQAAEQAQAPTDVAQTATATPNAKTTENGSKEEPKTWTLASLFAGKRKEKQQQESARAAQPAEKKTITTSNATQPQMASLAYQGLPGVKMSPLFSVAHEDHAADEEDAPVQVASLSGLARLAPSGLILQTEKVDAGCFKPELMQMLKQVETHYGRQVMVTSGLRPIKVNRAKQSLHTRCEAADIQVKGVSKWELADFLRSIPGRGGVGTYCHTESVHIDIGAQRDWNWRCRRSKG